MKKYILLVCTATFLLTMGSCSKDFLDKDPLDRLTGDQYWKSKADFDMALTAIYGQLQNSIFSYGSPNWDVLTDNGYGQHNYNGSQGIVRGEIFPSSGGYIVDIYNACYSGIARANTFLSKLAIAASRSANVCVNTSASEAFGCAWFSKVSGSVTKGTAP